MNQKTITVGIPAYNEGANIAHLLSDVLRQKIQGAVITEIFVVSDGSTDDTSNLSRVFHDSRITTFAHKKRKGKAYRQNEIITRANGDILVILDADIALGDTNFIQTLISPILHKKATMTSAAIHELPPRTFFEDVLAVSMKLKHHLFASFKNGNNLYTCHGPARAFDRSLFEQITFSESEGEDMYSYFVCVVTGGVFQYVPEAVAHYRLPSNFDDHKKQSVRYIHAKQLMKKTFGEKVVDQELSIPVSVYLAAASQQIPTILLHPIHIAYYLFILGLVTWLAQSYQKTRDTWRVATSKGIKS